MLSEHCVSFVVNTPKWAYVAQQTGGKSRKRSKRQIRQEKGDREEKRGEGRAEEEEIS